MSVKRQVANLVVDAPFSRSTTATALAEFFRTKAFAADE